MINEILIKLSEYLENIYSSLLSKDITDKILKKITYLELSDFDDSKIYNQIKKINDETLYRPMNILQNFIMLIRDVISLFGVIYIISIAKTSIFLIYIMSIIPAFVLSIKMFYKLFDVFNSRCEDLRFIDFSKNIFLKNENIKELKLYNSGEWFRKLINNKYSKYISEDKKIKKQFLKKTTAVKFIEYFISLIVKIFLVIYSAKNKVTVGNLLVTISSIDNLKSSINNILNCISCFYENYLYIQELFRLLDFKIESCQNKKMFEGKFKKIVFEHVYFKYPNSNEYVLEDLNFEIEANKFYSIIGVNGAGKTTLIKLLANLYIPTAGEILIDDINITEYDSRSIYDNVRCLFQDFIKYPLTINQNIGIGYQTGAGDVIDEKLILDASRLSGADMFISNLKNKYQTHLGKEWGNSTDLSLGQWQKIAIARALIKPVNLLILDEPTASLDSASEDQFFKNLKQIDRPCTIVLISHKLSVSKFADRIFVLKDKTIVAQGSHETLLQNSDDYKSMYHYSCGKHAF